MSGGTYEVTKTVEYTYDVFDRRIEKVVDADGNPNTASGANDVTHYIWDGQDVLETLDGQQRVRQRFLYGPGVDNVLGVEDITYDASGTPTSRVYWTLTDHQGSVRDVIDSNQQVVGHREYDAFGNITDTGFANLDFAYAFTGRDWDADVGLYHNRARWYDPKAGRWISQDPMGFEAGDTNLYRYVGNDPVNKRDPSGMFTEEGVINAFTRKHGKDINAMSALLAVVSRYEIVSSGTYWNDWYVDHEQHKIHISSKDGLWYYDRSDDSAADELLQVLAEDPVFYEITKLPESWEGWLLRQTGGGLEVFGGGASFIGGGLIILAPEPSGLTKIGGAGAIIYGGNAVVEGGSRMWSRGETVDIVGSAFEAYGRALDGERGAAISGTASDLAGFLFQMGGLLGSTKLSSVPVRQLPSATSEALRDTLGAIKNRISPSVVSPAAPKMFGPGIGNSNYMTADDFAYAVYGRYQQFYDQADAIAQARVAAGRWPNDPFIIGNRMDAIARRQMRAWLGSEDLIEGPGQFIQVNRWLRDPAGSGRYLIPDIRFPGAPHI